MKYFLTIKNDGQKEVNSQVVMRDGKIVCMRTIIINKK